MFDRSRAAGAALLLSLALGLPASSVAATPDPKTAQTMVQDVTDRLLATLRRDPPADVDNDVDWLRGRVEEIVAPSLDFVTMTKLAVGRQWRDASDDQKRALVEQFRELLLRTYSRSLQEYDNQKIEFLPLEPGDSSTRATVRSRVIQDDGPKIAVDYSLRYHDGEWLVYDIVVDGVSLVTNYRPTFSTLIREQGIDGLLTRLQRKNAQNKPVDTGS